jgi:hypothetical protein
MQQSPYPSGALQPFGTLRLANTAASDKPWLSPENAGIPDYAENNSNRRTHESCVAKTFM